VQLGYTPDENYIIVGGVSASLRCIMGDGANIPPDRPTNLSPPDNSIDVDTSIIISWTCADPDSDLLKYDIYLGSNNPPLLKVSSNQTDTFLVIKNLGQGTTFYWKVVARDSCGAATAGNVWRFTTVFMSCPYMPSVDYEGKTYHTIQIGNQCWLRENLDVGTMIIGYSNPENNGINEKYCYNKIWYNDTINCSIYGGLYQWNEAMQYVTTEGAQGICPPGWQIPSVNDFYLLKKAINYDGNTLKAVGQGSSNGAGTNTSGFTALLSGERDNTGIFNNIGDNAYFWSSTEEGSTTAYLINLSDSNNSIPFGGNYKDYGFSVRCLKGGSNLRPEQPSSPRPADNAVEIDTSVSLSWACSDPEGDSLTYDVYFGIDNPPIALISSNQRDTFLIKDGLSWGTSYYWKVIAKDNHRNTRAGMVWKFITMFPCPGMPILEFGGKEYHTVQIGTQCWLRENLDVGTFLIGSSNQSDNSTIEKYCYSDDTVNCNLYGGLYQWDEAMQYSTTEGVQGICPLGWHIPTYNGYEILKASVYNDGNSLKAYGQGSIDGAGTNTSGFSALLSGARNYQGNFIGFKTNAYFWTSSQTGLSGAISLYLYDYKSDITFFNYYKTGGYNIRCLQD
jgi:uncharacterized protein (TIGR02145 family)